MQPQQPSHFEGDFIYEGTEPVIFPYKTISGKIRCRNTTSFSAPSLEEVGGQIRAQNATTAHIPKLKKVGGLLWLDKVTNLEAPNLEKVVGLHCPLIKPKLPMLKLEEKEHLTENKVITKLGSFSTFKEWEKATKFRENLSRFKKIEKGWFCNPLKP